MVAGPLNIPASASEVRVGRSVDSLVESARLSRFCSRSDRDGQRRSALRNWLKQILIYVPEIRPRKYPFREVADKTLYHESKLDSKFVTSAVVFL